MFEKEFKKEARVIKSPYSNYGSLIHEWRNEIKLTLDVVEKDTGITKNRLISLEKGLEKPTWGELEKLAKEFIVSVRDLLPYEDDRDRGCIFLRDKEARKFDQKRASAKQYTYACRAMSSSLPNFKPVELNLHLTQKDDVVLNRGHFFHQFTQVLHGGPVGYVWEWEGQKYYEVFTKGDSWLITGFVPHGFWSADSNNLGRILAITFGQHLASSDAKQELQLIGSANANRISGDGLDYFPKVNS